MSQRVVARVPLSVAAACGRPFSSRYRMPSRRAYGETHSGSALRDFQSRRLNLRYRPAGSKQPTFCYTLNNTAIACPRILIAILENYQNADGSIAIPEALKPMMSGRERISGS